MSLDTLILWFPVLVIVSHLPHLILLDLKYREIGYKEWYGLLPMFIITGYLYAVGFYPIECMWISFVFVGIYYAAYHLHLFEGADFMLLMFMSLFYVVNPISGHYFTQFHLMIYLLVAWIITNFCVFMFNRHIRNFPMIPVIAAAFIMAVVFG